MENNWRNQGSSSEIVCRITARALYLVNYVFKRTVRLNKTQRGGAPPFGTPLELGEKDLCRLLNVPNITYRGCKNQRAAHLALDPL